MYTLSSCDKISDFIANILNEIESQFLQIDDFSKDHISSWIDIFECLIYDNLLNIGYKLIENLSAQDPIMCKDRKKNSVSTNELKYTPIETDTFLEKINKLKLNFKDNDQI